GPRSGGITLRMPRGHLSRLGELLKDFREGGLALMTDPDLEANVRLVWQPGQQETRTIGHFRSDASCLTGGFLAILVGEPFQDGGRILEDGFGLTLCPATWATVKEAFLSGSPIEVPSVEPQGMSFSLVWLDPPAPKPPPLP